MAAFTWRHSITAAAMFSAAVASLIPGHASAAPSYSYFNFNEPNATSFTFANSINNRGQIVGSYDNSGFLRDANGAFTDINPPDAGNLSRAIGINNAGQIVGAYSDASFNYQAFVRAADGSYRTLGGLGANTASVTGINDAGQIVGTAAGQGFVLGTDGVVTALAVPASNAVTYANGINNAGQVVGYADDGVSLRAFRYQPSVGYTPLANPPSGSSTMANDINNVGQIVGVFTDAASAVHGFLLDATALYTVLDDPAALFGTFPLGINDAGQIVGYYTDNRGEHGFLASPGAAAVAAVPEPGSIAVIGTALFTLGLAIRRRCVVRHRA